MQKDWNMERPKLLISVTGGTKNFDKKDEKLTDVFSHLVEVAESTGIVCAK